MRAVQLTAYGNPLEGLKYVNLPEPAAPGPNQILIEVDEPFVSRPHSRSLRKVNVT